MPSFGKMQSDSTIWQVAAFIYAELGISKQRYEQLAHGNAPVDNTGISRKGLTTESGNE